MLWSPKILKIDPDERLYLFKRTTYRYDNIRQDADRLGIYIQVGNGLVSKFAGKMQNLQLQREPFWRPQKAPKSFSDLAAGAHDVPPGFLVGWEGDTPLAIPHPTRRHRRLDNCAYGAWSLGASSLWNSGYKGRIQSFYKGGRPLFLFFSFPLCSSSFPLSPSLPPFTCRLVPDFPLLRLPSPFH